MAGPANITNTVYGRLRALYVDTVRMQKLRSPSALWVCLCDCGKYASRRLSDLRSGRITSCGCGNTKISPEDLTGKRYNRLIVTSLDSERSRVERRTSWNCLCDCGNRLSTFASRLKRGVTQSCGCFRSDRHLEGTRKPFGYGSCTSIIHAYKRNARKRELKWDLTREQAVHFFEQRCFYCGSSPANKHHAKNGYGAFTYNGIDRVDNTLGYTPSNCVPCCGACNTMKLNGTLLEFIERVQAVHANIEKIRLLLPVELPI